MSAHGWTGIAHLAGIPYDCLLLEEITTIDLSQYDALILTQCSYVQRSEKGEITESIETYMAQGGNIIVDGPFTVYDENGAVITDSEGEMLPGIHYAGFYGNSAFRLQVANDIHFITYPYERQMFVSQHLANGLNILSFGGEGYELIRFTDGTRSYPYLSVRESHGSRVMLVGDFASYSGASSLFRNVDPQVFYKNEVFNLLIRGLQWIIYGNTENPIPVPQLSNANLTSVIRLDADVSGNLDAQIRTINYLVDIARETGVVPLYAWVSSSATRAGWQELAPLGRKIEEVGGRIGTHSKYHRIDANMTPERWVEELDGSIEEIEFNTADYGYPVLGVEYMINPGNTIRMKDYDEVSRRMSFFMTHGFEQDMPVGFGNMTWFTGDEKNFVVVNNTPSPDYQWFNDPTWSYTTAQITAYQEAIYDHLYSSVGRGLVYNQMWHDYAITTLPQSPKSRIINESNIAMYDAMKAKFASTDIYAPEIEELGHKIRAMKQWNYSWTGDGNLIEFVLDLSDILLDEIAENTGGMGLRVDNTRKYIHRVTINGLPYFSFGDRMIVLPNLRKEKNTIRIELADRPSAVSRLTYSSKKISESVQINQDLYVSVDSKTKARLAFYTKSPAVLLNVDWQQWNGKGDNGLHCELGSSRTVILKHSDLYAFGVMYSNILISGMHEAKNSIELQVESNAIPDPLIRFTSEKRPLSILYNNKEINFEVRGNQTSVKIPATEFLSTIKINF